MHLYASTMLVALAGGVGAARFLSGLVRVVPEDVLTVIVNTADDETFWGLKVSPDLDTITYTLAGCVHPEQGWGRVDETFTVIDGLARFGCDAWFRLGDHDLSTHLFRTSRLAEGATLAEVTEEITRAWGLQPKLLPMSNDRVATRVTIRDDDGSLTNLAMQDWFVKERSRGPVTAVDFDGAMEASPAPGVLEAIATADTVIVCPSNPVISIGPILAIPGIREALKERRDRVVGISPIIAGAPVKGPADKLMAPLGIEVTCVGVARAYADFCGTLVIDSLDARHTTAIEELGVHAVVTNTLMTDARVSAALAQCTLEAVA